MGLLLKHFFPVLFPAYPRIFGKDLSELEQCGSAHEDPGVEIKRWMKALLPFVPIAACGAISLVAGNAAYRYASVSFLQMVKESHVIFVYGLMMFVGLETFKPRVSIVIIFIAMSSMIAVYGEVYFSWQGLSLQLVGGLAGSSQIVLNNVMMSKSSTGKIDPLTLVLCTAPVMMIALIPLNVVFWDARIPYLIQIWLPFLFCNALLAFCLQISAATLIWVSSGTGFALASVLKDLTIVAAAQALLQESLTSMQIIGFGGSVSGMALYSAMKLFPEKFEASA
jgi:drug/metabolite transporter (DMT)-like permease